MPDKPLCPYCGPWNGHPDGVEMENKFMWFKCPVCHSRSPFVKKSEDNLTAALRRFQPMQKPMTLEEVKQHLASGNQRPLRIEFNPSDIRYRDETLFSLWRFPHNVGALCSRENQYNVVFRFWLEEPTDEERAAAKWEEPSNV